MLNLELSQINESEKINYDNAQFSYIILIDTDINTINQWGQMGYHIVGFDFTTNKLNVLMEQATGTAYYLVNNNKILEGVVKQNETEKSRFLIKNVWTYADICQTALLILISVSIIFAWFYHLFNKKRYYD